MRQSIAEGLERWPCNGSDELLRFLVDIELVWALGTRAIENLQLHGSPVEDKSVNEATGRLGSENITHI